MLFAATRLVLLVRRVPIFLVAALRMVQKPPTNTGREGGSFHRLLFFAPDWQIIISINDSFLNFQNLLPSLPT
jgi:hypothetical protein